jgi:hypothetical protein
MNSTRRGLELANTFVLSKIRALGEMRETVTDLQARTNLDTAIMALEQVYGRIVRAIGPVPAE